MKRILIALGILTATASVAAVTLPYSFSPNTQIKSSEVNADLTAVANEINSHEAGANPHQTNLSDVLTLGNSAGSTPINFNDQQALNMEVENLTADPTPGNKGRMFFNTTEGLLKVDDGSSIISVAGTGVNTLASVLNSGNSAGSKNINMNENQLLSARIENLSSDPSFGNTGRLFYNTADAALKVDTGSAILAIGGAQGLSSVLATSNSAGTNNLDMNLHQVLNNVVEKKASDPTNTEGRLYYNTSTKTLRLYNGSAWTNVGNTNTLAQTLALGNSAGTSDIDFNAHQAKNMILFNNAGSPGTGTPGFVWYDSLTDRLNYETSGANKQVCSLDDTQTLTNKTISGASNTISNVGDSALSANVDLLNGTQSISGVKTFTANPKITAITSPTGATMTIPSGVSSDTFATVNNSQTLSGKTLASPIFTGNPDFQEGQALHMRAENLVSDPSPGNAGRLYYKSSTGEMKYDNGSNTITLASSMGVTTVTASSPIQSSGGTAPDISCLVASGSQAGCLSSSDWTSFNSSASTLAAATSSNTPGTLVKRDGSGNFSAGTVTASLTGNVTGNVSGTAASITGNLTGDVTSTGMSTSYNGVVPINKGGTGVATTSQNYVFAGPFASPTGAPSFRLINNEDVQYYPQIGTPTHVVNISDYIHHFGSSSVTMGGGWTDNGNGTVTIGSGEVLIRQSSDIHAHGIYSATFPSATITPTDGATTYIYVTYNAGSPIVTSGASFPDGQEQVMLYVVFRSGNELNYVAGLDQALDNANKESTRLIDSGPLRNSAGGCITGTPSGLYLSLTACKLYYGQNLVSTSAYDTSVIDTNIQHVYRNYYHSGGVWTSDDNQHTLNNTQYDNGTNPTAMTANWFKASYIYLIANNPSRFAVVMSQAQFHFLADAQASSPPSVLPPALMSPVAILVGRAIVQASAATLSEVDSNFKTQFAGAPATNINSLSGGPLTAVNGGTGQTSIANAFISFYESVATTLGDLIYGGASGAPTRLAGDTSNTRKFLRTQSTAGVANAPAWDTVTATDVGLGNVTNKAQVAADGTVGLSADWNAGAHTITATTFSGNASTSTKPASGSAHGAVTLDSSGNFQSVSPGTSGNGLVSNGTDWASTPVLANPMTTGGDIIYGGASGAPTRLANGTAGQLLKSNGTTTAPSWVSVNVTDWVSYTPTLVGDSNGQTYTNQTTTGMWRRVGDTLEVQIYTAFSGAPGTGTGLLVWSLPATLAIDTSKLLNPSTSIFNLGSGTYEDSGTGFYSAWVRYRNTTTVFVSLLTNATSFPQMGDSGITPTIPITIANGDKLTVRFSVPISGWSIN